MSARLGVLVMSAVLVLYLVAVAQLAISLILTADAIARIIGIALIVLPLIGAWAMVAELTFGVRSQRLTDELAESEALLGEELPGEGLPKRPSGRPDRAAADAEFPRYQAQVEQNPDDWKSWFRLGLAYDASGDRKRARRAIRRAIALKRAAG